MSEFTMRCVELNDLIDLYIDDELPEETRAHVERHLMRCPECAFHVRGIEQTKAMLCEACPIVESSPSFRERMAARLQDALGDVIRAEPTEDVRQRAFTFPA
jgi:Predicted transmembrane transcriptional regulator (anti-sigma factor)